jgi:hypothetical protein
MTQPHQPLSHRGERPLPLGEGTALLGEFSLGLGNGGVNRHEALGGSVTLGNGLLEAGVRIVGERRPRRLMGFELFERRDGRVASSLQRRHEVSCARENAPDSIAIAVRGLTTE